MVRYSAETYLEATIHNILARSWPFPSTNSLIRWHQISASADQKVNRLIDVTIGHLQCLKVRRLVWEAHILQLLVLSCKSLLWRSCVSGAHATHGRHATHAATHAASASLQSLHHLSHHCRIKSSHRIRSSAHRIWRSTWRCCCLRSGGSCARRAHASHGWHATQATHASHAAHGLLHLHHGLQVLWIEKLLQHRRIAKHLLHHGIVLHHALQHWIALDHLL
mmetsp:Transcript_1645/g.2581  ORF Transcript_1645/g.2581 Transcript_1645/m.2581 type:complete len:222 (+) Transcript_1645:39-704(+)